MADGLTEIALESNRVAALFVEKDGVYANLPAVDVWDEARDARTYAGPWPVVAHPPCNRWGQLANVNHARYGTPIGEDGGCFEAAPGRSRGRSRGRSQGRSLGLSQGRSQGRTKTDRQAAPAVGASVGGSDDRGEVSDGESLIALPDDRLDDLIHDALNEVEWDENEPYRLSDREFADGVLAALRELKERRANG